MTTQIIPVNRDVLAEKRVAAECFRAERTRQGTLVVHLMSSPGAGKTTLLQATARLLRERYRLAVLVGDLATERDAERLRPLLPAMQITTGGACHLEIGLVEPAFARLDMSPLDFLFIEDVGNLVCPASHDVGHHLRVLVQATTEGDDKAGKYPKAFRTAQALVINKIDLLAHVPFSIEVATADAHRIQPDLTVLHVSALTGAGIAEWCRYLENERQRLLAGREKERG